jgi:S-adenosylmethionine-dependent methyltransferase
MDPQAYRDYLRSFHGRLRCDLAWENLRGFLPSEPGAAALDIGGGTGEMAVRLAAGGLAVTVVDASAAMLAEAERAATAAHVRDRVTLVAGEAGQLTRLFPRATFAVIVCHNVLEFMEYPVEVLRAIPVLLQRRDQVVASVIVRNRAGEVLSAALKNNDLAAAERNLTARKVTAKLIGQPVSVFSPREMRQLVALAGLETLAEYGIRVFSDYLPENSTADDSNYAALLEVERKLGAQPDFAAIARYSQVIVRPRGDHDAAPGHGR